MGTPSPTAAMQAALAAYLTTAIASKSGFEGSECVPRWPQPTADLIVNDTRVTMGIVRLGAGENDRLLGPAIERITPGVLPAGSVRYEWGVVTQRFQLGLWAISDAMRDDADQALHEVLNRPFAETCPPLITGGTALAAARPSGSQVMLTSITAPGRWFVTITANLDKVWRGTKLAFDDADVAKREVVTVDEVSPFGFWATFRKPHAAAAPIVEKPQRSYRQEAGLSLRCPDYFNAIARFDFMEPQYLDAAKNGRQAQSEEWVSIREGFGMLRQITDDTSAVLRKSLTLRDQFGPTDTDTTPKSIVIY